MPTPALIQKPPVERLTLDQVDPVWRWVRHGLIAAYSLGADSGLPRDLGPYGRDVTGFDTSGIPGTLIYNRFGDGREWSGRSVGQGIILPDVALTDRLTVLALISTTGADADLDFRHVMSRHPGWVIAHQSSSSVLRVLIDTGTTTSVTIAAIADYNDGELHLVGMTYDGATIRTYFDGLEANNAAKTGNIDLTGATRMAGYWNGDDFEWFGRIVWTAYWDRPLSPDEILRLNADPLAAFRLVERLSVPTVPAVGQTIVVGTASESEIAQVVTPVKPITKVITGVSEIEVAQTVAPVKVVSIGSPTETEVAQTVAVLKPIIQSVGTASESEVAQALAAVKVVSVITVTETETSQTVAPVKIVTIGTVTETEIAQAVAVVGGLLQVHPDAPLFAVLVSAPALAELTERGFSIADLVETGSVADLDETKTSA